MQPALDLPPQGAWLLKVADFGLSRTGELAGTNVVSQLTMAGAAVVYERNAIVHMSLATTSLPQLGLLCVRGVPQYSPAGEGGRDSILACTPSPVSVIGFLARKPLPALSILGCRYV